MARRFCLMLALVTVSLATGPAKAAPPVVVGTISGFELAPQYLFGSAVFLIQFRGTLDGRSRTGIGLVSINHEALPTEVGGSSAIIAGDGTLVVGLTRLEVQVTGGLLTLVDTKDPDVFDDAFEVSMNLNLCNRSGCGAHVFQGLLDHEPFPPTIKGTLGAEKAIATAR
jgi:hypothetical protein